MPTITTFVTVPPSVFDIHYWMFGMFVTFAITALILGILIEPSDLGLAGFITSDTFIITALIGMFAGSLISLFMNIIPWIVPVVIFASLILYIWRGRG